MDEDKTNKEVVEEALVRMTRQLRNMAKRDVGIRWDDLVSDVFIQCLCSCASLREQGCVDKWILAIYRYECCHTWARSMANRETYTVTPTGTVVNGTSGRLKTPHNQAFRGAPIDAAGDCEFRPNRDWSFQEVPDSTAVTPEQLLLKNEISRRVIKGLGSMVPHYREIIEICYIEGVTNDEAKARLGLNDTQFRLRKNRATRRLEFLCTGAIRRKHKPREKKVPLAFKAAA